MEYNSRWFKFYGQDWLTDLKIMRLSVVDRLCYITLLCLASSSPKQGVIRECDEEALLQLTRLYDDPLDDDNDYKRGRGCLKRFETMKMVTINESGDITIKAFVERQNSYLTNAERQAKYRVKHKESNDSNDAHVTEVTLDKIRVDKSREDKNTSDLKVAGVEQVMKIFHKINPTLNWGNKNTRKAAADLIKKFGLQPTIDMAEQVTAVQGKDYAPVATTPYQMKEKLAQFKIYFDKEKSKQLKNNIPEL